MCVLLFGQLLWLWDSSIFLSLVLSRARFGRSEAAETHSAKQQRRTRPIVRLVLSSPSVQTGHRAPSATLGGGDRGHGDRGGAGGERLGLKRSPGGVFVG